MHICTTSGRLGFRHREADGDIFLELMKFGVDDS
jgi:hypothetical protein